MYSAHFTHLWEHHLVHFDMSKPFRMEEILSHQFSESWNHVHSFRNDDDDDDGDDDDNDDDDDEDDEDEDEEWR